MRSTLGAALVIGRRILRQRIRDRSALLFAVVTPLGLALAFSVLIPNDFQAFHTHFVIVDLDGGPSASHLADEAFGAIASAGVADVSRAATEDEARAILDAGDAGAVVVIPAGFSEAIASGTPTRVRLLGGEFPASFEVARSVVTRFAAEAGGAQLLVATAAEAGVPQLIGQAVEALSAPPPDRGRRRRPARAPGRTRHLLRRRDGDHVRVLRDAVRRARDPCRPPDGDAVAAPGGAAHGRARSCSAATLASLVLGLLAMTVLVVGSSLLAHATWGSAPLVAVLLFAGVFAASGISMLVSTVAHTPRQAGILNSIVALSLAAIGGVFLPLSQAPQIDRRPIPDHAPRVVPARDRHPRGPGCRFAGHPPVACRPPGDGRRHRWHRPAARPECPGDAMKIAAIVRTNLIRSFRDRLALFFSILLPLILILVLGLTFGAQASARIGVVNLDGGSVAADLVASDTAAPGIAVDVRTYDTPERSATPCHGGSCRPRSTSRLATPRLLAAGRQAQVTVLTPPTQRASAVRTMVDEAIAREVGIVRAAQWAASSDRSVVRTTRWPRHERGAPRWPVWTSRSCP